MLTTLRIRNLALVADLTLEFPAGLVVVTGETGAGKSIVLGALNLLLGQRADRNLIRAGSDACTVEAGFNVRDLPGAFHETLAESGLEPCEDHQLLLKRSFTMAGTNRQFVNGTPTTLAVLAEVGDWLVDVHGPHDHQSLLQPARQLAILDAYGKLAGPVEEFARLLRERSGIEAAKAELDVDGRTLAQRLDLLRFQVGEITAARLNPEEARTLESEHQRAHNAARLLELGQALQHLLAEAETSVLTQLGEIGRLLQELRRLDPDSAGLNALHEQATGLLHELQTESTGYLEGIEVDPTHLEAIEQRLDLIQGLKRKYGVSIEAIIDFGTEAARQLAQIEGREGELARLDAELARLNQALWSAGARLGTRRRRLIPALEKAIARELSQLGFPKSRFEIALDSPQPPGNHADQSAPPASPAGLDSVEFQFTPNPGEPPRPLRTIASSGEMARVMLAIKTVLAAEDQVPVLVFDEVDANVGGQTAHAVGAKMAEIAHHRQVFCITHLAPVAAAAGAHFCVAKSVRQGRTYTEVRRLLPDERVDELTRMLGGQGEAARKHARALLESAPGAGP